MLSRHSLRCASHAAARSSASAARIPEQQTKLPSGLVVASADNHGPIAHFVLAFRAGARYEGANQSGLVHHLRNLVGKDSKQYGGVQLIWSAASAGAEVRSFSTADLLGVQLSVPRDSSALALSILGHLAADPAVKEWELEDVLPSLRTDMVHADATDLVLDGIRRAAYRNGPLGQALLAAPHNIGKYSGDEIRRFVSSRLVANQGVLYGINIEHERLRSYGELAPVNQEAGAGVAASPYKGGEFRQEAAGPLAHVIIAGPGAAAGDATAQAVQAVLVAALGQGPSTKLSGGAGRGLLATHVKGTAAVSAYQAAFEGEGLVGAYLLADASHISEAVPAAARALKSFSAADLEGAKKRAKLAILRRSAHSAENVTERAAAVLAGVAEDAVVNAIDSVTAKQVEEAAAKAASRLSLAAYGNIATVPYRDQL